MIEAKETIVGEISSNQNLSGELLPRGPKGDKGEKGDKGDKGDTGAKGADGKDGAIQYEAGENITIEGNVISATGGGGGNTFRIYKTITDDDVSPQNDVLLDLNEIKEGDYIVVNRSSEGRNTFIKFFENQFVKLTFSNGIYQIMKIEEEYSRITIFGNLKDGSLYSYNYRYDNISQQSEIKIYFTDVVKRNRDITINGTWTFSYLPNSSINPTNANEFTRKGYVDALPTTYSGYDSAKTQILKNINGTLTWVDE